MCGIVKVLLVSLLVYVSSAKPQQNKDTLRLLQIVHRHGDRNPVLFYPNDPYKDESYWPEGPGMLTPTGQQQLQRLGRYFRKVYKDYLPEEYSKDLVYVRCTERVRTQDSVKSLMKELFVNTQSFTDIDIYDADYDELITPYSELSCPAVKRESERIRASDEFVEFLKIHSEPINYIKEHAGVDVIFLLFDDLTKMAYYRDTLFIENLKNFSLPEWTATVFPEYLKWMADKSWSLYFQNEVIRRTQGGLLKTLADNMIHKMEGTDTRRLNLFSAHDATIVMLMRSIGIPYVHLEYASYMAVELHELSEGYHVRLLLQNETVPDNDEEFAPREVNIPGCDVMCPWDMFVNILTPYMPEDWKAECDELQTPINYL